MEEYGIPVQISKKLIRWLSGYRSLYELLDKIATLPPETINGLDVFERNTVMTTMVSLRPTGWQFPLFGRKQ